MSTHPKVINKVDSKSLNTVMKDISSHGCILLYHWNDCGHCRNFMPTWDKLKEKYGNIKQFYEIELSTIRQAPDVFKSISGFPTIVAYVGNGSNKVRFQNSRDEKSVSQFIEANVPDYDKTESKLKTKPISKPISKKQTPHPKTKTAIKKKK
jgi:thiol-disulfide isomerase/thioredoxin